MKEEIKKLTGLLSQLKKEEGLQKRIQFLEREVARLSNPVTIKPVIPKESHLDLLRTRIKELEEENHALQLRIKKIVDELE